MENPRGLYAVWQQIKSVGVPLSEWLVAIWLIMRKLGLQYLLILAAYIAFAKSPHGRDFLRIVGEKGIQDLGYFTLYNVAAILWSVSLWYSSRILLKLEDLGGGNEKKVKLLIAHAPRMLGIAPILILAFSFWNVRNYVEEFDYATFYVYLLLAFLFYLIYWKRSVWVRKIKWFKYLQFDDARFSTKPIPFKTFWKESDKDTRRFIRILLFVFIFLFSASMLPVGIGYARMMRPATIVITAFMFLNMLLTVLIYINTKTRPVFLLLILITILFSYFNDNTSMRKSNDRLLPAKQTLTNDFNNWVDHKKNYWLSDSSGWQRQNIPVFFIAAQGGGIRALAWTAGLLHQLNDQYGGEFYNNVYAISGVSGGGVGAVFYNAFYRDRMRGSPESLFSSDDLFAMITEDYLSDVTNAYAFSDNLQKIIPHPIEYFSRSNRLEDVWAWSYHHTSGLSTFDSSFLSLWYDRAGNKNYDIPNLFLNGTLVETGSKTIIASVDFKSSHFANVLDVHQQTQTDVPVKTAASLCSRFPIVTAAAKINSPDTGYGHIADGGYYENTGIETALQIMNALSDEFERINNDSTNQFKLIPILLFIRNGSDALPPVLMRTMRDLQTPLNAFYKAWDMHAITIDSLAATTIPNLNYDPVYLKLELERKSDDNYPLSWYISDEGVLSLKQQLSTFSDPSMITDGANKQTIVFMNSIRK